MAITRSFSDAELLANLQSGKNVNESIQVIYKEHFQQWTFLFNKTVNDLFKGKNAELAINRAASIADIIRNKLSEQQNDDAKIY